MAEENIFSKQLRDQAAQVNPTQPGTGSIRQFLSTSMMKLGSSILASGISEEFDDPNIGRAVEEVGSSAVSLLNQRFWKDEDERFSQTYVAQYDAQARKIQAEYDAAENAYQTGINPATGEKIDPYSPQAIQARTQLMQDAMNKIKNLDIQFMQNASKYPGNPLIGQRAANLMTARNQQMNEMMGAYPAAVAAIKGEADLAKAAQDLSPESMLNKKEMQQQKLLLTKAQTRKAEAEAKKAEAGEQYNPLQNVPVDTLPLFFQDPRGGAKLLQYYRAPIEANLVKKLVAQNSMLEQQPEKLQRELDVYRQEIDRKAIGHAMTDLLSPDRLELAKIKHPEYFTQEEVAKPQLINEHLSPKERQALIQNRGPDILNTLEKFARRYNFSSVDQLLAEFDANVLKPEIESMVDPKFRGAQTETTQLHSRALDYLIKNWNESPFLKEIYGGKAPTKRAHRRGLLSPSGPLTGGIESSKKKDLSKAQQAAVLAPNFKPLLSEQPKRLNRGNSPNRTKYDSLITKNARLYNIPAPLIKAVVAVESTFKPSAKSSAGAVGLMQLMPETARDLGVKDRKNPEENVRGGTQYLMKMYDMFGDWMSALSAYNTGPANVRRYGGETGVPRVTEDYVEMVVENYKLLANPGPDDPIMKDYELWQKKKQAS